MEKPTTPLFKTCSACGQQKPLSAFLQMTGPNGTTYGTICTDCRKANADKLPAQEQDETTTSNTGLKVDSKAKVADDLEKNKLRFETDEQYYEEREEKDVSNSAEIEKTNVKSTDEKKHRDFLKRNTFIGKSTTTTESRHFSEQKRVQDVQTENTMNAAHAEKQTESAKSEQQEKEVKLDASTDTGIAGKIKYTQGQAFKEFARWSGGALGKTFSQPAQTADKAPGVETPSEVIEKNWGPSSRRK